MPTKYALADAGLRFTMALLFLVSATTKVTETTAIQPTACLRSAGNAGLAGGLLRIRCRPLPIPRLSGPPRPVAVLLAGWCLLTALIFHRQFSDLDQLMNFFKNLTMAGGFLWLAKADPGRARVDASSAARLAGG